MPRLTMKQLMEEITQLKARLAQLEGKEKTTRRAVARATVGCVVDGKKMPLRIKNQAIGLLRSGEKIECIKLLRRELDIGLREAVDLSRALEAEDK